MVLTMLWWEAFYRQSCPDGLSLKSLKLRIFVRMPGFLEVFGYYSEDLGRYNIDVGLPNHQYT